MSQSRLLPLCAAVALAACHHGAQPPSGAATPAPVRPARPSGPSLAAQTAGLVEAPAISRSTGGVRLKFAPEARPMAGEPLTVDLALLPSVAADSATLAIGSSRHFTVVAADRQITLPALEANQVYRQSVDLTPAAPGVALLDVTVSLHRDANVEVREFALPLIVGGAANAGGTAGAPADAGAAGVASAPRAK